MKEYRYKQILLILMLLISASIIIFDFFIEDVNDYILYGAFILIGLALSLEVGFLYFYNQRNKLNFLENRMKMWNDISYRVKKAGEVSFNEMPLGIVVFDQSLRIEWANNYAKEIFLSPLVERNIKNIDDDLTEKIMDKKNKFEVNLYGRTYSCILLRDDYILYLTDITEKIELLNKCKNNTPALGVLNLDNLEPALGALDAKERSLQVSNLIGIITEWADNLNIATKGYSDERYILIFDYDTLEQLIETNFVILDRVKEYCNKENLRITASIGIACDEIDATALMDEAYNQLELALNRGGNQAVVKKDGETIYFGAKTESFEARTPISIRFNTEELISLITESSNVFILGHKAMDADSFGAAIGMRQIVKALGREAKIIFDESFIDETVSNIYKSIKNEHIVFLNALIDPKLAHEELTDESLLIIVDVQYQSLLMDEKIYKKAKKIAIIDHHRRNTMAINDSVFLYTHPAASSVVELIIEMSEFVEEFDLSEIEATWLLVGISVDTNNFLNRTTSRTFNAVAKLQLYGADMSIVRKYLREDFQDYVKKTSILNNMEIIYGEYGVALCDDDIYQRAFLAKIADNMIGVNDIKIAFCIGKVEDDTVGISARSLGDANVQVIMERLGGGGHFNSAATQIKEITMEKAKELLIESLKLYKGENRKTMKVILIKDVKGKGKAKDVIDVPNGYANHLIRSKQAIVATPNNIKHLEYEKNIEDEKLKQHIINMEALKEKVEASPLKVVVKVGQNGKLFGSVSTKLIVDEYKKQYGFDLDKRKIMLDKDKEINALGTYKIPIQLHNKIIANMTIYVVEKE